MKNKGYSESVNRRDFFRLGTAGVVGMTLAGIPQTSQSAEKELNPPEVFMMFPGNYTWSSSVRNVISSIPWGGGAMGEIYKVCAALMGRVGDNKAWFAEWKRMGEKVAALGEEEERHGHLQTASGAFMRAAQYIQVGERQLQPRTPESQKDYARSV